MFIIYIWTPVLLSPRWELSWVAAVAGVAVIAEVFAVFADVDVDIDVVGNTRRQQDGPVGLSLQLPDDQHGLFAAPDDADLVPRLVVNEGARQGRLGRQHVSPVAPVEPEPDRSVHQLDQHVLVLVRVVRVEEEAAGLRRLELELQGRVGSPVPLPELSVRRLRPFKNNAATGDQWQNEQDRKQELECRHRRHCRRRR